MKKILSGISRIAGHTERGICYAALLSMAVLPVVVAALRPFNMAIPGATSFLVHIFLVAGLFAAMLTTRAKEHISISIVQYFKDEKLKTVLSFAAGFLSVLVTTVLFWNSLTLFVYSPATRAVGIIPQSFFKLIMATAYGVMALRFAIYSARGANAAGEAGQDSGWLKAIPFSGLLLGSVLALPAIAKIIWGFEPPQPFYSWVNFLYDAALYIGTPLILLLILAALAGAPIFVVIGAIALVMLQAGGREPETGLIHVFSAFTNGNLIAIPLFTLTGFLLSESKAGQRLVAAFRNLFGWIPGGMIIATVVICAFFTSFTGASGVTILALGGILFIILQKGGGAGAGHSEKFSLGLLTSAGGVGILFPPSLPIILVASTINSILFFMGETVTYTVIDFFLGAIIPGIILMLAMIVYGVIATVKVTMPTEPFKPKENTALRRSVFEIFVPKVIRNFVMMAYWVIASVKVKIPPVEPFKPKETVTALKGSAFEILLPVILVGGFFSGILTLVEVSAVSVVYVFIVQVFIHRDIALKDVPRALLKAVPIVGGIISILAMAQALSYSVIYSQVPENFALWMRQTVESRYLFLLLLNVALLLLGSFMDIFSAILVVLPLVVPLALVYEINPIHLGIIFIINLEAGFLTPPVGMNLFMASYRFKRPFMEICRYVLPFLGVRMIVVLLVTYIPWFSSVLVGLFG
ncbi:MAG: TRAP transporter large permease subunit [Treponema sp.]|nr:TRAP transporter large permease subunit [Treponema sp.]